MYPFWDRYKDGTWNSTFFDSVGDGSGSIDMGVDGSVTPQDFLLTAPNSDNSRVFYVHRFVGCIRDTGNFAADGYAASYPSPGLTNGMELWYKDPEGNERLMTDQHPIRQNVGYAAYCYDMTYHSFGVGPNALVWRFTMTKDGAPFELKTGASLIFRVNDDVSMVECIHVRAGLVSVPARYARN